jgi:hypothetical protein
MRKIIRMVVETIQLVLLVAVITGIWACLWLQRPTAKVFRIESTRFRPTTSSSRSVAEAKESLLPCRKLVESRRRGLLRRSAPRNDTHHNHAEKVLVGNGD